MCLKQILVLGQKMIQMVFCFQRWCNLSVGGPLLELPDWEVIFDHCICGFEMIKSLFVSRKLPSTKYDWQKGQNAGTSDLKLVLITVWVPVFLQAIHTVFLNALPSSEGPDDVSDGMDEKMETTLLALGNSPSLILSSTKATLYPVKIICTECEWHLKLDMHTFFAGWSFYFKKRQRQVFQICKIFQV